MSSFFKKSVPLKNKARRYSQGYLFLDFDGTLSPIVKNPEKAKITKPIQAALKSFIKNRKWKVAIVSGRDIKSLRKKTAIYKIILVGNHGFEIQFQGKPLKIHPAALKARRLMASLRRELQTRTQNIPGIIVENKIYSLSLHTRNATSQGEKKAHQQFWNTVKTPVRLKKIRITKGKKVMEVRPPANWNKGKAVEYLLNFNKQKVFPVYVGDDTTDEDAFKILKKRGLGIRVGDWKKTHAHTTIKSVNQMPALLNELKKWF